MSGFPEGLEAAFGQVIAGIITSAVVISLISAGVLDPSYYILFSLLDAALIFFMPTWGISYLVGWIFAILILLNSGLIGIFQVIFYLIVPIIVLFIKVKDLP